MQQVGCAIELGDPAETVTTANTMEIKLVNIGYLRLEYALAERSFRAAQRTSALKTEHNNGER